VQSRYYVQLSRFAASETDCKVHLFQPLTKISNMRERKTTEPLRQPLHFGGYSLQRRRLLCSCTERESEAMRIRSKDLMQSFDDGSTRGRTGALLLLSGLLLRKLLKELVGRAASACVLLCIAMAIYKRYDAQKSSNDVELQAAQRVGTKMARDLHDIKRSATNMRMPPAGVTAAQQATLYPPVGVRYRQKVVVGSSSSSSGGSSTSKSSSSSSSSSRAKGSRDDGLWRSRSEDLASTHTSLISDGLNIMRRSQSSPSLGSSSSSLRRRTGTAVLVKKTSLLTVFENDGTAEH
jgi:hypothetical protein